MRLGGLGRGAALVFPVAQAAAIGVAGWLLALILYAGLTRLLDSLLGRLFGVEGRLAQLTGTELVASAVATLAVSLLATIWAALAITAISPRRGLPMHASLGLLLAAVLTPVPALAEVGWDDYDWNPQPMEGDVVLPMPCDGAMAFRRVETPVSPNWLADAPLQMGSSGVAGQEHSESLLAENVVGGLSGGRPDARFYLLGKYEISRHQYLAVMGGTCPPAGDELALPAEGMSWLEAQQFAAAYTQWLYVNARDTLWAAADKGALSRRKLAGLAAPAAAVDLDQQDLAKRLAWESLQRGSVAEVDLS